MYIYMYAHVYIIYTYIHTHRNTHTHMHAHTYPLPTTIHTSYSQPVIAVNCFAEQVGYLSLSMSASSAPMGLLVIFAVIFACGNVAFGIS